MAKAKAQPNVQEQQSEDGLLNLRQAAAYLGVTDQRIRTILREGRVEATKNEKGYWRVTTEALDAYNATKGTRQSGAKAWVFKATQEEAEQIQTLVEDAGMEFEFSARYNYDPAKAKAYRLARQQKLAEQAAAEAEAES